MTYRRNFQLTLILLTLILSTACGCQWLRGLWGPEKIVGNGRGIFPGTTIGMTDNAVILDIYFIRIPPRSYDQLDALWQEVDEQHLPPELRQKLAMQGFRAGLVGGQIPVPLSRLMGLDNELGAPVDDISRTSVIDPNSESLVSRKHVQSPPGQQVILNTTELYDRLTLYTYGTEPGDLRAETYPKSQPIMSLKAWPEPGGAVRIMLQPEVRYGDPKPRFTPVGGVPQMVVEREVKTYDELLIEAKLMPGHFIVMGNQPGTTSSAGAHFFTSELNGRTEQKLLLVRVAQTQHDDLFRPSDEMLLDQ